MQHKKLSVLLLSVSFCFCTDFCVKAGNYYINASTGNDSYTGTSTGQAWASLEKINGATFSPGDSILFCAGTTYNGQLEPKGSGNENSPIVISSYGSGEKPVINGHGEKNYTVLLYNVEYWEVSNLEISNHGKDREACRVGVKVEACNFGDCRHITLKNLKVRDVNGSLVKAKGGGGGIYWHNHGDSIPTRFIGLLIENCHLVNCGRNGIYSWGNELRNKWYPSLEVVIRKNLLEKIPGDGIVPIACDGCLVEYNVMRDSPDILSPEEAAAGIWPWSCDNTIIQYNEVSGHKAKWDGQGFDVDYNSSNTVIQYNYSHDNAGGFLLICNDGYSLGSEWNKGTENNIIHHNISINDGLRDYPTDRAGWFSPVIHITGPVKNTVIHDNLILVKPKLNAQIDRTLVKMDSWGETWPENTRFHNNFFIVEDEAHFSFGNDTGTVFENNVYIGNIKNLPEEKVKLLNTFLSEK